VRGELGLITFSMQRPLKEVNTLVSLGPFNARVNWAPRGARNDVDNYLVATVLRRSWKDC